MSEIYWITRLDGLYNLATACIFFGLCALAIAGVFYSIYYEEIQDKDEFIYAKYKYWKKRINTIAIPVLLSGVMIVTFLPSTKEALIIFGIGGTIDYVKQDSVAQKLPYKCIVAIDKFLDEQINDK